MNEKPGEQELVAELDLPVSTEGPDLPPPHVGPDLEGASDADVEAAARHALHEHTEAVVRVETAREGQRRASLLVDDLLAERPLPDHVRRPPMRLQYPRFGWRRAIRHAVDRRMVTR
ncbi:MAG: hypothetical protein KG028_02845, partial [Actinobacteria bacterium]|nr:hypothetical protein [Actinomycetota bacterium]